MIGTYHVDQAETKICCSKMLRKKEIRKLLYYITINTNI